MSSFKLESRSYGVVQVCNVSTCTLRQESHELKTSQGQILRLESRELEACYFLGVKEL